MRLIDQPHAETEAWHADTDEDAVRLLGPTSADAYRAFLCRTYGFVAPVERSIAAVSGVGDYIDVRRFHKHELLRRDLVSFQMTSEQVERLPQCTVPVFDSPAEALGWAYLIERHTLAHSRLFHHLASVMPGEVAFTSSYLKCYFGAVGEMWRAFGQSLDRLAENPAQAARAIDAAKTAYRCHRTWRHRPHDARGRAPSEPGKQHTA
jgi:heme oxygenase